MTRRTQEAPLFKRPDGRNMSDRELQQLTEMQKLTKLNLSGQTVPQDSAARRTGTSTSRLIPDDIDRLWPNLTHLNLSRNLIRHVPDGLGRLTKLRVLDLGDNKLGQFPVCILRLMCSLTTLVLSGNKLQRIPPDICILKKLEVLRLANNRLKDLPDELCFLEQLNTLSLQNNGIVYLPRDLYKLNKLYLQIPQPGAGALDDSEGLTVNGNPLEYPPLPICQQGVRKMLDYMQNNPPSEIPNVLDIRNRGLSTWPTISARKRPQVTAVYAEDNSIGYLPSTLGELFPNVRALHLDRNNLQTFPPGLYNVRLERLSLVQQQVRLTMLPPDIGMLVYLQELDLSGNDIQQIPADIRHLQQLRVLDLQQNELQELPDEFCELRSLECLFLRENNISELPHNIGSLGRLRVLQLSRNRLIKLPDSICRLGNVAVLTLRFNCLVSLPQDLDNLEGLSSPEPFFYAAMHTTFRKRKLRLSDNPGLMFPPFSECSSVTTIFNYLRTMRRLPQQRDDALRRVENCLSPSVPPRPPPRRQQTKEYRVLTPEFRVFLAQQLATELYQMCCLLRMGSEVWNQIWVDHGRDGVVRQGCELMQRWLDMNGGATEPELVNRLREALQGVGRNDLVYELNTCVSAADMNGC